MILPSTIADHAKRVIQERLQKIEKSNNVHILFAIESGSRAWGFPSADSDYDVRFVYVRPHNDYLSIQQHRDVIEVDTSKEDVLKQPLDLNGWDIRKGLELTLKSNAVFLEWLQSPVTYVVNDHVVSLLLAFAQKAADLSLIAYHYHKLMSNVWTKIEESGDSVRLKHYFYALRPALALEWIDRLGTIPPMDMHTLVTELVSDVRLLDSISRLIVRKSTAQEHDITERISAIDSFIASKINGSYRRIKKTFSKEYVTEANKLFRKIIAIFR